MLQNILLYFAPSLSQKQKEISNFLNFIFDVFLVKNDFMNGYD